MLCYSKNRIVLISLVDKPVPHGTVKVVKYTASLPINLNLELMAFFISL